MAAKKTVTAEGTAKKETKVKATKAPEATKEKIEIKEDTVIEEQKKEETVTVEEAVVTKEVAEEIVEKVLSDKEIEKTQELIEEFSHPETKLEEIVKSNPDNVEGALKEELKRVENIEKTVKAEVNKNLEKLSNAKSKSFREFWCGVSDGWNN